MARFTAFMAAMILLAGLGRPAQAQTPSAGPQAIAATTAPEVVARRGKTALSKLALGMKPGTWAELKTEMPAGLWTSPRTAPRADGGRGGFHIAGWTDDAHWDSRTGQFLYMGLRQTRRFIAYDEQKNAWRSVELDTKSDNPVFQTQFGHIYGNNGFDHERGRFYHRYGGYKSETEKLDLTGGISYFDTATEKWTKLPPRPETRDGGGMCIEYFNAMDGLVTLGRELWFFSNARQAWEKLGNSPVDGYHSMFRHNPFRGELLFGGGNNNRQVLARLTRAGKVDRLKDLPAPFGIRSDKWTVDPVTGRYLMISFRTDGKPLAMEFDSDQNEYRLIEAGLVSDWPFSRGAMPVCAFIPEYGVIMWAEQKVFLYKHDPQQTRPLRPADTAADMPD